MAQNNFNVNDELLKLVQQQAQPQRQAVLNTGLLSGNQQNFGDVLRNPDQAQVNAGIAGVAALLSGRDAGTALVNSANAFGNTRQQTYNNQLKANEVQRESLKDRLSSALNIGKFGLEQDKFNSKERKNIKAADGRYRYVDDGTLVFEGIDPIVDVSERKSVKAADGRYRYLDNGTLVFNNIEPAPSSNKASAVTEIFENGLIVQAYPNGEIRYTAPDGTILQGAERVKAIAEATAYDIKYKALGAGEIKAAEAAIAVSKDAYIRLDGLNADISTMGEAITELDKEDGAWTGPIISRLPSIRESSIRLDNIQRRLGLNIIGNTTFGALSQGELELALATGLPTNLQGDDLRTWLVDRQNAQRKLSVYLQDSALFLGTPGNTVPDWIKLQKAKQVEANKATDESLKKDIGEYTREELIKLIEGSQ